MAYSNKHKQFLQYFMHARMVSETNAIKLNHTLFSNDNIENTIELINSKIIPLEFKINRVVCEQNGDACYVFVATFVNDFNVKHDPSKAMFAELVNYIIIAGGSVPYEDVITFNSQMSDTLLNSFLMHKYLITDNNRNIFLSPLAISELEEYLVDKFLDKRCSGCLSIVVHGVQCKSCKQFAHGPCLSAYFKNVGGEKCPKCSTKLCSGWNPVTVFNEF